MSPRSTTCPWLNQMPLTIPSMAWSSAQSSKTMFAALPPSSSVSATFRPASSRWIALPTSVEPVNAILSMPSCWTRCAPVAPSPVTMLTTPGGSSACRQTSVKSSAVSGVVSAGLSTTVLPQARAGAIFHASMSSGKFHGMICPATPERSRPAVRERVFELVRPAGVVEEVRRRQRQVDVAGLLDRLATVERLGDGELARALLQDPRDPEQVLGALGWSQLRPAVDEGVAGGPDRQVDVLGSGLRHLGQHLLARRRDGRKPLAGARLDLFAADEQPVALLEADDVARLGCGRVLPFERRRNSGALLLDLAHVSRWSARSTAQSIVK